MKRALLLLCLVCSCADAGQERVSLPLSARGSAARTLQIAGASVTLTRAELAFGPAYLCASEQARAELCEVARAELLDVKLLNALDGSTQPIGTLAATTGTVGSGLFDYGISWLLTEAQPRVSAAAPGGHSALLEGTLESGGRTLRFLAAIDVKPQSAGEAAVNGQRNAHELTGTEQVVLTVDPQRWIDRLDVEALLALSPDASGQVTIAAGTLNYESILQGMVSRAPVAIRWE
jgi:hypothetical protein